MNKIIRTKLAELKIEDINENKEIKNELIKNEKKIQLEKNKKKSDKKPTITLHR